MKKHFILATGAVFTIVFIAVASFSARRSEDTAGRRTADPGSVKADTVEIRMQTDNRTVETEMRTETITAAEFAKFLKTEKILEKQTYYDVDFDYPQLSGYPEKTVEDDFNVQMRNNATTSVAIFTDDYAGSDHSGDPGRGFMKTSVAVPTFGRLLFVEFTGEAYSGGVHPYGFYLTRAYDTEDKEFLEFKDLFMPDSGYLEKISDYAIQELVKDDAVEADWARNGAGPDERNFEIFRLDEAGLHLTFPPYQVAVGAAGPQEILMPWTEINGLVKDIYRKAD